MNNYIIINNIYREDEKICKKVVRYAKIIMVWNQTILKFMSLNSIIILQYNYG